MKIDSLRDLFLDELKDAYDFEHQLLDALPKMADNAHDPKLQKGFLQHLKQTEGQVQRLEQVFLGIGEKAERKTCKGMKGLIEEGEEFFEARGDEAAVDAALIGAAQRVEHYEMAAYGTLRSMAETLGHEQEARLLQETLEQEERADEKLSRLAERRVNPRAADGVGVPRRTTRGQTKDELYEQAQRLGIEGRSKMSKQQLARAVQRHG